MMELRIYVTQNFRIKERFRRFDLRLKDIIDLIQWNVRFSTCQYMSDPLAIATISNLSFFTYLLTERGIFFQKFWSPYLSLYLCQSCSITNRSSLAIEVKFWDSSLLERAIIATISNLLKVRLICSYISRGNLCHITKHLFKFLLILTYHLFKNWLANFVV